MSKIIYHQGSLFKAPVLHSILVHACNCQGRWGSGIAKEFARRFPEAHKDYQKLCDGGAMADKLIGSGIQFHKPGLQPIGYLFTSRGYGEQVDPPAEILHHTYSALKCILDQLPKGMEVHAPKINSGLFCVPWEKTEAIIEKLMQNKTESFHVWEVP